MNESPFHPSKAFRLAVQKSRAIVYLLAVVMGLGLSLGGALDTSSLDVVVLALASAGSALLFWLAIDREWDRRMAFTLDPIWLGVDLVVISYAVLQTGGAESPWFPWYLANISAAAFVAGQRASFVVALADTAAYVAVLTLAGDIRGFGPELVRAVTLMACLYAASYFFIRGVPRLHAKQRQVRSMQAESEQRVQDLVRLTEALEERTEQLALANRRLREADRLKSRFLANVSHELRTPLNSIIGFSEILTERLNDTADPRHLKFLSYINRGGEQLLSVINDILDLAKVEAGEMQLGPERIPLTSAVEGIVTVLRSEATKRSVSFSLQLDPDVPMLEADPSRFKQILYHLLANAVKFSPAGGQVEVAVRAVTAAESPLGVPTASITVRDEGIGIDADQRELIFEPFRQVDGTASREYQGAGLGLTLVKRFVEMHSGQVSVDSDSVHGGSLFEVLLPFRFAGDAQVDDPDVETHGGDYPVERVLVVEDDTDVYTSIAAELEAAGYAPVRARNGDEALRLARAVHPLAITLDLVMPGLDGFSVLRRIRSSHETSEIPVVIVSMLENREMGLALGADDFFVKPVDTKVLLHRIHDLIANHRAPRKLLVIDDDPALHEMIAQAFAPPDYLVVPALSGYEGLDRAREVVPDLVVLDLMMDGMSGFEVASALRSEAETRDVPIVILTAMDLSSEDHGRLQGKMDALVHKGDWSPVRLESVVREVVERSRVGGGAYV